ncbi:olfactory receptor 10A5-like [Elgaria multicarinata webbii]|uniref:olfactory receptor 10A5-like n=1 Tax=Elgaria multicarinata webbii TaxID=159646 RepID=UPI002FCD290F
METTNGSFLTDFILLGLANHPDLQLLFFIVFLFIYIMIIVGNMLICIMIMVDPSLHAPMYFFLKVLSFLDICYSSVTLPKMLVNFLSEDKRISYIGCASQMFFLLFLGASECFLLAAMAFDRYVAICKPLRYMTIMNKTVCLLLTALSGFIGNVVSLLQTAWVFTLPFCGSNQINYFSSHLIVVTLYYGSGSLTYLRPKSINAQDSNKVLALMYTAITPMLNPIIYSLRNAEIHGAIQKIEEFSTFHQEEAMEDGNVM